MNLTNRQLDVLTTSIYNLVTEYKSLCDKSSKIINELKNGNMMNSWSNSINQSYIDDRLESIITDLIKPHNYPSKSEIESDIILATISDEKDIVGKLLKKYGC